jgi:hypothetical protein
VSAKRSFTTSEIALLFGVDPRTVRRWIRDGELLASTGREGRYVISLEDLASLLMQRSSQNTQALAEQKPLNRRQFLGQGILGLVAIGALGDMLGSGAVTMVYQAFARAVQAHESDIAQVARHEGAIRRLFGGLEGFGWSAGLGHLVESYGLHDFANSSTMRAASSLGAALHASGSHWLRDAVYTGTPPAGLIANGNLIATGSPINDLVARRALEYVGSARYELKRSLSSELRLSIEYVNDSQSLPIGAPAARRYVGGQVREMPNWTVRLDGELLAPPRLDANGWLTSDYLLVSRVPNVLTRDALLAGREVLVVGGSHGPGTEGVGLLLQDAAMLELVASKLAGARHYQVLIPIIDVQNVEMAGQMRTVPLGLGEPIVRPLAVDYERVVHSWIDGTP